MAYPIFFPLVLILGVLSMAGVLHSSGFVINGQPVDNWKDLHLVLIAAFIVPILFIFPLALGKYLYENIILRN